MFDQAFDRMMAVALALVTTVDHQAPQEELALLGRLDQSVVVEHHEADQFVTGVDGAEPRFRRKVGLRNRHGVRRNLLAAVPSVELAYGGHGVLRHFPQFDGHGHWESLPRLAIIARFRPRGAPDISQWP